MSVARLRSNEFQKLGKTLAAAALLVAASGSMALSQADPYYQRGQAFFKARDYRNALQCFANSYRANTQNVNAIYYQAMCCQALGDKPSAIRLYASIVSNFSSSPAAQHAASALASLDPRYLRQLQRTSESAQPAPSAGTGVSQVSHRPVFDETTNDQGSLPDQCRVPFVRNGSLLVLDAYVNNQPIDVFFDTGAESVCFGNNHLSQLHIPMPGGKPIGQAAGVGSSGTVPVWGSHVNIKVGTIERRNFPIMVQETMPTKPLLGQTFFREFAYTIDYAPDKQTGTINFVKKGSRMAAAAQAGGGFGSSVPFIRDGNNIVLDTEVNGKKMAMFFDTGASTTTFTEQHLKQLGISIPDDARVQQRVGIGGAAMARVFPVNRLRMGPIEKSNFDITAVQAANMNHPLLGQDFFGDWQYTIDDDKKVIRFVRR